MPRKPKHGGRRKGAGRPRDPKAYSARLVVRLTPELLARTERAAAAAGWTVPKYVRSLLGELDLLEKLEALMRAGLQLSVPGRGPVFLVDHAHADYWAGPTLAEAIRDAPEPGSEGGAMSDDIRAFMTHQWDDEAGIWRQLVSPARLREILDADGENYDRPDDFGPDDEWSVA